MTEYSEGLESLPDGKTSIARNLTELVLKSPRTLIDTNIFFYDGTSQDFIGLLCDADNYSDISLESADYWLGHIRDLYSFVRETRFNITPGVINEMGINSKMCSESIKYLNMSLRRSRRHFDEVSLRNLNEVCKLTGEYGRHLNLITKKLQHLKIDFRNLESYNPMKDGFERFYSSGRIRIKGREIGDQKNSKFGEAETDSELVSHALHSSMIDKKRVDIISNDGDIEYFLKMTILYREKFFRKNPNLVAKMIDDLKGNPISIYKLSRTSGLKKVFGTDRRGFDL